MEGRLALTTAVQALQLFTDRFGPYPYTELDVVEAPIYGGAAGMEFPGLVMIANLFYRPIRLPWSSGTIAEVVGDLRPMLHETQEFVVAHEVAHQWWNATVASDAVQHPFLDESLANFSALLYFERMYGRRVAARHAFVDLRLNYLVHRMAGGEDAPVNLPVTRYATGLQYAAVVYGKGGLFYLALRRLIGDAAFFAALRDYYQSHYLRVATPAELQAAILRHSPDAGEAKALYVRWIEETHGDEDLGTLTAMGLFKAAIAINLRAARGEDLPRDPVVLLRQLIEDAAQ